MTLTWVDYAFLIVVTLSMTMSCFRGFIKEAMSLLIWLLAVWVAVVFMAPLSVMIAPWISTVSVRMVAAFVMLFIMTLLLGGMVNYLLSQLMQKTGLSSTDRFLGIFFGFARGVLFLALTIVAVNFTPFVDAPVWQNAHLVQTLTPLAEWITSTFPNHLSMPALTK